MNREGREFKDIALLISSSINAIHPYLDANGRMSRVIYVLLTNSSNVNSLSNTSSYLDTTSNVFSYFIPS